MDRDELVAILDDPGAAAAWLDGWGVRDAVGAHRSLRLVAEAGVPLDLLGELCQQLQQALPLTDDPDMALANLSRFICSARSPLSLASLFYRQQDALQPVLQIGSTSQPLSDSLIRDPESLDLLRMTEGQPVARQLLIDEVCAEAESLEDKSAIKNMIRRCKQRETVRIAYGDLIQRQPLEIVSRQLSYLADALLEAAVRFAYRTLTRKKGVPFAGDGGAAGVAVLAMGKLGGEELSYGGGIDLLFVCDEVRRVGRTRTKDELGFFRRLAQLVVELLGDVTELGAAYHVTHGLQPREQQGAHVMAREAALRHFDVSGRTHERQAFVKARAAAGDAAFGQSFLRQLQPWVYGRYLSSADISGIKALKRKIERRARHTGEQNIAAGSGGIADVEFVIQFLQLLNGGDTPLLRTGNTLEAIGELERAGCLTHQERSLLEENYTLLRRVEHRLQVMSPKPTSELPESPREVSKLAAALDYRDAGGQSRGERFLQDLARGRRECRQILDHLLNDAFADAEDIHPATDLVLDPAPDETHTERLLEGFGFRDARDAYQRLMHLSEEGLPFLSTPRCRHFLAAIAPRLLEELSRTPDPDGALRQLSHVSASLGGKGVLWELFSESPPTLKLYVRLCATSDYLTSILNSQPGMIDELMDSLVLERLAPRASLERQLTDLCRGAEQLEPVLTSFKNLQHLRIGVRDVLGKNDIQESHAALADVADVILRQVAQVEMQKLHAKHGTPLLADATRPADYLIVALGKLGGREPNYHSDLNLLFLYEGSGQTATFGPQRQTTNQHFFGQLSRKITKRMTHPGVTGRLYDLDARLQPPDSTGLLAFSLASLLKHFERGADWEQRMALCKARIVLGSDAGAARAMHTIRTAQFIRPWTADDQQAMLSKRAKLRASASSRNLKRGPGGTMDVEWLVYQLQMTHGREQPSLIIPNTIQALAQLAGAGLLSGDDASSLRDDYRFLRTVESRLRLLNTAKRHDLPDDPVQLSKLAYLLEFSDTERLEQACSAATRRIHEIFSRSMQ